MNLLTFLFRAGRRGIMTVILAGIIGGLASAGFVALVNAALHTTTPGIIILGFIGVAIARVATNLIAQWNLVSYAQEAILQLCNQLSNRVIETPFRTLERIGAPRIMTTLTDDVGTLSAAVQAIPTVITNAAVLLGCILYLAVLSPPSALALVVFGILGAIGYRVLMRRASGPIAASRRERDALFRHYRTITEGVKEVKMNRARRDHLLTNQIPATTERLRRLNLDAARHYLAADGWTQSMFFLIMGVMLFGLPAAFNTSPKALSGFAFVALYAMGPVWSLLGALPVFHRGQTALARIDELGLSLAPATENAPITSQGSPGATVELRNVSFAYDNGVENGGFMLGPVDLVLNPGEMVFFIGGNGSGKSTFVKLLTGLYPPDAGAIRINGHEVTADNRESYREHFAAVFSDFHLFGDVVGLAGGDIDARARSYLALLGLDQKVTVQDGVLSTTALSQGQKRRLALMAAYLEDRPIYVFDEWAADQDPSYRQIFYSRLLPELKARGKTVVVITHDDRYFHMGDRVVKLDYGRIVESWRPSEQRDSEPAPAH